MRHMPADGARTTQAEMEIEPLRRTARDQEDLFMSPQERIAAAHRDRARNVAFAAAETA